MPAVSREQLKNEIDALDGAYLELAYKIIRQLPHISAPATYPSRDRTPFSQRWRGKLSKRQFSKQELEADPRLDYLVKRCHESQGQRPGAY